MPYRDDQAALEAHRDELRRDLAEATRQAEALAGAEQTRDDLTRELASVEARLQRARARHVPLLDDVKVASPCNASWDDMIGDERVRFCGSCQKDVYNLSAMPRDDAERLLAEREGSICVRLYRRADGTVLTSDCPVGVRRKRVRRTVVAAGVASALAGSMFARASVTMGEMAPPILIGTPPPSITPSETAVPVMGSAAVEAPAAPPPRPTPKPASKQGVKR